MTQALRYSDGKPKMHYLHPWYNALSEVCAVSMEGEKKYERGNYLKGQGYTELLSAAERHIFKFGHNKISDTDTESNRHHLAHAIWNLLQCLEHEMSDNKQWDDRLGVPK